MYHSRPTNAFLDVCFPVIASQSGCPPLQGCASSQQRPHRVYCCCGCWCKVRGPERLLGRVLCWLNGFCFKALGVSARFGLLMMPEQLGKSCQRSKTVPFWVELREVCAEIVQKLDRFICVKTLPPILSRCRFSPSHLLLCFSLGCLVFYLGMSYLVSSELLGRM